MVKFSRAALILAALASLGASALSAENAAFSPAFSAEDIDFEACSASRNGTELPHDRKGIAGSLGLGHDPARWTCGDAANENETVKFQFLLALKQPAAVGSMAFLDRYEILYAKEAANHAPDPGKPEQWAAPEPASQTGHARMAVFPTGFKGQYFLIQYTGKRRDGAVLEFVRFYGHRLGNLLNTATVNADSEWSGGGPGGCVATNLVDGKGRWQNCGLVGNNDTIRRAPISEGSPSWFVISWDKPQAVSALYMEDNFKHVEFYGYTGPEGINPAVGLASEWTRIRNPQEVRVTWGRQFIFPETQTTRGIKLLITATQGQQLPQIAEINALQVYADIGNGPLPAATAETDAPKFTIPYTMPEDGTLTIAVNDSAGKRVRTLVSRTSRAAGAHTEGWDLTDDAGNMVKPGSYKFTALTLPNLEELYQMTAMPNIATYHPENSPWLNGVSGPGGWMGDHSPPRSVCAIGERVFLGDPCAESGVALIECDLTGKKSWGCSNLKAWTGPSYLASDGASLFAGAPGDNIWRIDMATKKVENFLERASDSKRLAGLRGMAAVGGKLYVSVKAADNWLDGAATSHDVDLPHCLPLYPVARKSNNMNEPNLREDFMRLFRLTGTPPGLNGGLLELETTSGAESEQHIVLAFNAPVPLGSVILPVPENPAKSGYLRLSVLKPGAPYPPRANADADWIPFESAGSGQTGFTAFAAPKNTLTRALRITFANEKDALKPIPASNDNDDLSVGTKPTVGAADGKAWRAKLDGVKLLRRRFENVFGAAKVRVSSGSVNAQGEWNAQRTTPLSEDDPGIFEMEWTAPQSIRGLAIKEIDGARTEVDVYEGATDAPIDIKSSAGWRNVASYKQKQRYYYLPGLDHNSRAKYVDGYVDFGEEVQTRAVRLRVVEQWTVRQEGRLALLGVRADRGGLTLDPTRCSVYGVAALHYLGGEAPIDPLYAERLETFDIESKKLLKERTLPKGGPLEAGPGGALYGLCGDKIVKLDPESPEHDEVVALADLKKPIAFTLDASGKFYVFDADPERENVRVYDTSGKFLRTIGGAGGTKMGPYDANFFSTPPGTAVDLAIDKDNQLWVVQCNFSPKRVTVFSTDGALKWDFLGNTMYGGGGALDPNDTKRLFFAYNDATLEFELDWQKGTSRLKNMAWLGDSPGPEYPYKIEDRTYLVTRPQFGRQRCGVVYLYEKDHLRRVAAIGLADAFKPLQKNAEVVKSLGKAPLADLQFIWTDKNGDGEVQPDEVTFTPKTIASVGYFDRSLGLQAGLTRFEVQSFLPNGAPVYAAKPAGWSDERQCARLPNGNYFSMGARNDAIFAPDGKELYSYKTEGNGVQALNKAGPYTEGQVVSEFDVVGTETAKAGDLGTFLVTTTNVGSWNIWTADGLLAGRLFSSLRAVRNSWSMPACERGIHLEDVTIGQEHFAGYFCQSADGRYFAVAGHNHVSVVEVKGLERAHRTEGTLTVSAKDVDEALKQNARRGARESQKRAKMLTCVRASGPINPDGNLDDWRSISPVAMDGDDVQFRMAFNDNFLYVSFDVRGQGPLLNHGGNFKRLFKTGAAVDLQMGVDPSADLRRDSPARGDFRLLMTMTDGKPVAVLYQPVNPAAPKSENWETHTDVAQASFDRVAVLTNVRMGAISKDNDSYTFEAAIPLDAIGLKITPGMRVKADFGVLIGGPNGTETIQRKYWSNQATQMVSDEAVESQLQPSQWGYVTFAGDSSTGTPTSGKTGGSSGGDALENMLNDATGK